MYMTVTEHTTKNQCQKLWWAVKRILASCRLYFAAMIVFSTVTNTGLFINSETGRKTARVVVANCKMLDCPFPNTHTLWVVAAVI
jgi:hypothetical protein